MRARQRALAGLAAAASLLAGCASIPSEPASLPYPLPEPVIGAPQAIPAPPPEPPPSGSRAPAEEIVMRALSYLGTRYRYGGSTPQQGFDCSGFIRWVFRGDRTTEGDWPRSSAALMQKPGWRKIAPARLQPADLLFFRINGRRVSHVGLYIGNGRFVHAPSRGGKVRIDALDEAYWKRRYAGARRVAPLAGPAARRDGDRSGSHSRPAA